MHPRTLIILLSIGLAFASVSLIRLLGSVHLPGNDKGYSPGQPIAYSHRLHAGDLEIPCLYCHSAAEKSRHAGVPAASICMNCHKFVTAPLDAVRFEEQNATAEGRQPRPVVSPELRKLYDAFALGENLEPTSGQRQPIEWVRVHRNPDHVYFDHRVHVNGGVDCRRCHGAVETMERVSQEESLSMGWCLGCHRHEGRGKTGDEKAPSTDCAGCHY